MDIKTIKEKCGLNFLEIITSNNINDLCNSFKNNYKADGEDWLNVCENLISRGYFIYLINNERCKCNLVKWFNYLGDVDNLGGAVIFSLSPSSVSKSKIEYLTSLINQYLNLPIDECTISFKKLLNIK